MKPESRQARRIGVQLPVVLTDDQAARDGTILNISSQGCAITADPLPKLSAYLSLRMVLRPGEEPVGVELAGVRWVSDYRCGLEFIRVSAESRERVHAFVALLESTP